MLQQCKHRQLKGEAPDASIASQRSENGPPINRPELKNVYRLASPLRPAFVSLLFIELSSCAPGPPRAPRVEPVERPEEAAAPEPEPPTTSSWSPEEPHAREHGGVVWSRVEVTTACKVESPAEPNASPVRTFANDAEFEAEFCRKASVDWNRFRLAALWDADPIVDLDVVNNDDQYQAIITTRRTCESSFGASVHLLLPADNLPIAIVRRPAPPPDCPDGYGY